LPKYINLRALFTGKVKVTINTIESNPVDKEQEKIKAGYAHVNSMVPRADYYAGAEPLWHSWALREAFVAGANWQLQQTYIAQSRRAGEARLDDELLPEFRSET
jgi:hypothetical protein